MLTKRPERVAEIAGELPWPPNVWMGTSVENADYTWRVRELVRVPAKVRFLSVEPLLGPIRRLPLRGVHWVIVGGESGPGARPMLAEWATDIRDQCNDRQVPFFFKQWGGVQKSRTGRELEGRTWDEMPKVIDRLRHKTLKRNAHRRGPSLRSLTLPARHPHVAAFQ